MDVDDVGMIQARQRPGLVAEASQEFGADAAFPNHLQGNEAFELLITGLVDRAHAALAE